MHHRPMAKHYDAFSLTLFIIILLNNLSNAQEIDVTQVISSGYDPTIKPQSRFENEVFNVSISVYINELLSVTEATQSFQVDMFVFQEWIDPRLNVSQLRENLVLTQPSHVKLFWLPDLYFINSKEAKLAKALEFVQKLTITKEGLMHYMVRLNATFGCPMNLLNYPHDYHYCRFKMSSCKCHFNAVRPPNYISLPFPTTVKYNQSELKFVWTDFDVKTNVEYPMFKIRSFWTTNCNPSSNNLFDQNSCLSGTLKLVRRLSYYVIRYYLLTFLSVVISFIGFWIPLNAWPGRANIMVSPLLGLITQDIAMNNDIGVSYTVSVHIWMMFVEGFVYMEIIEYAVAIAWGHFVTDKKNFAKMLEQAKSNQVSTITSFQVPQHLIGYYFGNKTWYASCGRFFDRLLYCFFGTVDYTREPYSRNKVDYIARLIFPFFFMLFVVIYILATTIEWSANFN